MDAMESNPNPQPNPVSHSTTASSLDATVMLEQLFQRPFGWWLRKFFACNPFYLVSAALLLYGLMLVSLDGGILSRELVQLSFNFGALQAYELLLVITAIALARRQIWYDSVLLVSLENMLVLVPFILISQAALLHPNFVWVICFAGGFAALVRFWGLKHFFKELNLPRRALVCGFVLLLINFTLPLIFRHLNETKLGTKPTDGAAYEMNRLSWLLLLPAMFALIHLLPRARAMGGLLPQRRWLPAGLFLLWICASGVHLYSLSYVYNFDWEPVFKAPLLWVVVWSVFLRRADFVDRPVPLLSQFLLLLPACATLFALGAGGNMVFTVLTIANIAGYGLVVLKEHRNRVALNLALASLMVLLARILENHPVATAATFGGKETLMLCGGLYALFWIFRSRDAKAGLLGGLLVAIASGSLLPESYAGALAAQFTMVFLLLHSLRWNDTAQAGASVLRLCVAAAWLVHSFILIHVRWEFALPVVYGVSGLLLAISLLKRFFSREWTPIAVSFVAIIGLLLAPGNFIAGALESTPESIVAIAGSFLLFALGTLAALTKSKWNPPTLPPDFPSATDSTR